MLNIYTATAKEIAELEKIGSGSAEKIVELRDAVIAGFREPIVLKDLVKIRLGEDYWQTLITTGQLSIDLPAGANPKILPQETIADSLAAINKQLIQFAKYHAAHAADIARIEKKQDDNLQHFIERFGTKMDAVSNRCAIVESRIDEIANIADKETNRRLTAETELMQEIKNAETKLELKVNKKVSDVQSQISQVSIDIGVIKDHLNRQGPERSPEQGPEFGHGYGYSEQSDAYARSHGFLEDEKVPQHSLLNLKEPLKQSEIIDRIQRVCPPDSIYQRTSGDSDKNKQSTPSDDQPKRRGRSKNRRGKRTRNDSESSSSDRSLSPLPPKLQEFSGDPNKTSWSGFIIKFERTALRHKWSEEKKLDRLLGCLTDKALEYAVKSKNNYSYTELKAELKLRFDLTDEPVTARNKLHDVKQTDDETLEAFMQRVLSIANDGYAKFDAETMQQLATESFLRGCQNKEAASLVMIAGISNVQEACRKMKMIISGRKAVQANKVSFQERLFSAQEEKRVSDLERDMKDLKYQIPFIRSRSPRDDRRYAYQDRRYGDQYSRDRPYRGNRYSPSPARSSSNFRENPYVGGNRDSNFRENPYVGGNRDSNFRRPSRSPSVESRGSSGERVSPSRDGYYRDNYSRDGYPRDGYYVNDRPGDSYPRRHPSPGGYASSDRFRERNRSPNYRDSRGRPNSPNGARYRDRNPNNSRRDSNSDRARQDYGANPQNRTAKSSEGNTVQKSEDLNSSGLEA